MPAPPPPPSQANLPHNWTELIDPKTGHPYYFNTATKESSWTPPRNSPGLSESSAPPPPPSASYGGLAAVAAAACAADRVSLPVASSSAPPPPPSTNWGAARGAAGIGAEWTVATDPASGAMYWWNRDTGARTWEDPTRMSRPATPEPMEMSQVRISTRTGSPQTPMDASARYSTAEPYLSAGSEGSTGRRNGSILAKIDGQLPKRINTYLLRPWLRKPPPASDEARAAAEASGRTTPTAAQPPWWSPRRWCFTLVGAIFYGVLFVPFIFAVLQQTMTDGTAVDPFGADVRVSRAAWISGYVYVAVVSLFVIIVFSLQSVSELPASDPMLLFLFGCVVAFILIQQALTLRYVLLRPELSTLRKKPKDQLGVNIFKICGGRVLSSMDPKKWTNYIYLSVIVFEFFQFTAVLFQPAMPWVQRPECLPWPPAAPPMPPPSAPGALLSPPPPPSPPMPAIPGACAPSFVDMFIGWLQLWLPEFLTANVFEVLGSLLIAFCSLYLFLIGEFVYSERTPGHPMAAVVCDLFAGAVYTTVVARLLRVAVETALQSVRVVALLALFVYCSTATFVGTLGVDESKQLASQQQVKFLPKWVVIERTLKGTVGILVALLGRLPGTPALVLLIWTMVVTAIHITLLCRWRTCTITFVTRARVALLSLAALGQAVTMGMLIEAATVSDGDGDMMAGYSSNAVWGILLIVLGALALAVVVAFAVYKVCFAKPPETESPAVKAARELVEQEKAAKEARRTEARRTSPSGRRSGA